MRRLLAISATLIAALAAPSAASARQTANQFAVGSAKTDLSMDIVLNGGLEHASFSAHNVSLAPNCDAKGQIVYKNPTVQFTANIDQLVIMDQSAYLSGSVVKATSGPVSVGAPVSFDAYDSGLPGGQGDQFLFEGFSAVPCFMPTVGHLITSGNIIIKPT
jgi:hypothetical protein